MNWVRIQPLLAVWPGGGGPPTFEITADENGSAVIELAWDPQALMAPATYPDLLRYYSTNVAFNASITNDDGSTRAISVPVQTITLAANRATWSIPQALWEGYLEEVFKTLRSPARSTFSRTLYYRVRVTPPGGTTAQVWPIDGQLQGTNAGRAPHIGIVAQSQAPASAAIPDLVAVQAMGGIPIIWPTLWGTLLQWWWAHLPETDTSRRALVAIFAHPTYTRLDVATRAKVLRLWLFAGPAARPRLPELLSRSTATGSNVVQPVITKTSYNSGGKTLVDHLLELLSIVPHPDIGALRARELLLDDVITEILDPNGQVNQGAAGTCSPTAIQTLLITVNPAEYVRLQLGLMSSTGQATLANGSTIQVAPTVYQLPLYTAAIAGNAFLVRTYAELGFQAAMLRFAQGAAFPALTGTPAANAAAFQATIAGGLMSNQTKTALDGLFNVNFTTHYVPLTNQAANVAAQPAIRDGLLADLPGRQQQMVFAMYWSAPYNFGHVMLGVRRDQGAGRVFFKNPQYAGSMPPPGTVRGAAGTNPPRVYDDPSQSLESIADADLLTWVKGYWVPDTALI